MTDFQRSQPLQTFEAAVRSHQSGNLQDAERLYRAVLERDQGNAEAWHLLGMVALQTNRLDEAARLLRQATTRDTSKPEYHANLGNVLQARGQLDEAINEFRKALRLQPGDWQIHFNLANALRTRGALDESVHHYQEALRRNPNAVPVHTNLGITLLAQGKVDAAIESLQKALHLQPGLTAAQYHLAKAFRLQGNLNAANAHLRDVLRQKPDFFDAHLDMGLVNKEGGELAAAETCFRQALQSRPNDADASRLLAGILRDQGKFAEAVECNRRMIDKCPQSAEWHYNLGLVLEDQGKLDEALDCYQTSLRLKPDFRRAQVAEAAILEKKGDIQRAYDIVRPLVDAEDADAKTVLLFATLCRQRGDRDLAVTHLDQLLERENLSVRWRTMAHTQLGEALDALGRFDDAFAHFRQANRLKPGRFDAPQHTQTIDATIRAYGAGPMATLPRATNQSELPLFIVGMPRSGTSLVEQILAYHTDVHGAGELTDVGQYADHLHETLGSSSPHPGCLGDLTRDALDTLADDYLQRLRRLSPTAVRVTDKMPYNYLLVGLIRLLFPASRIIHCVRDPLDTCVSCFFRNFLPSATHTTDLRALGSYHNDYRRLMRHWTETLRVPMLEVRYEELVQRPEEESRGMVEYVGLRWDPNCLRFHESNRFMNTASYQQVRQPVYTKSVGRWRNYRQHIKPLMEALE
jgi:tetratricopeptide (TPR) repeat protein